MQYNLVVPKQRNLMLRHSRLVMMVLVAMLACTAPTALAQSPAADQYGVAGADAASGGNGGAGASGDPVGVQDAAAADLDKLPFTGGEISLIALIGLALLVIGLMGCAATRRRESPLRA